jgi:hypothetical protein
VCVPLHDELGSAGEKESSPDPTSVSRSEHSLFSVSSASRRWC